MVKKICLVIPSLQAGGMERVMSELAVFFCALDHVEVHIVLYGRNCEVFYDLPANLVIHKPEFVFNDRLRFLHAVRRLLYLRREVGRISPDSVLSFGEIWNSFVLLALSGLPYKVFISDRCSPAREYNTLHTFLRKILYPGATGIIAQTEKARELYAFRFRHQNISVIGNPIRKIDSGDLSEKENIVLMVGRLIRSKNQDKLIEMFLRINLPGWKLVLVGYDHLKQNLSETLYQIITRYNASDRVVLAGKKEDVETYYRRSKIFAFPSSSEGFPNAIGEAMSSGLPVVAFDCIAGPSDLIKDNWNGFLVPVNDFTLFQNRLEIMMKDQNLREIFGKRAMNDVKAFSSDNICRKYFNFITDSTH
jgi:glycosyltransferase involved in cell wall biosynthesis